MRARRPPIALRVIALGYLALCVRDLLLPQVGNDAPGVHPLMPIVIRQPDLARARELCDFIVPALADLDAVARDEDVHSRDC